MTEIEFRRVYSFRLAVDLLLGFTSPRGYDQRVVAGRISGNSHYCVNAKECIATTLLMPFGLSAQTDREVLRDLYNLHDEGLSEELEELREEHRREMREARAERDRRNNDGTESATEGDEEAELTPNQRALWRLDRENRRLARAEAATNRSINDLPRLVGRGRPAVTMPPPPDDDDDFEVPVARPAGWPNRLTEDVDASYVSKRSALNRKNKKTGIPDPPKPAKPKPKRRLVVGRKRPPVVED